MNFVILYFIFFVMDWNLKAPSWDLVDHVDKATTLQQNIGTKEEQNRFGVYRMKGEFSVDLKLGHIYLKKLYVVLKRHVGLVLVSKGLL